MIWVQSDTQKMRVEFHIAYIIKNNINFYKMATKQLGTKVLTKIENLICEIDKPTVVSTGRRKQANQSIREYDDKGGNVYSKLSYTYQKKHEKTDRIIKGEVYEQEKPFEKFKVTNKTTLKILNKKEVKPIHQRVKDILTQKDKYVKRIQLYRNERELQSMKPVHRSIDSLVNKKFHQSDLEEYRCQLDQKNKQRIKKRNMNKLPLVKAQDSKIPIVNQVSRSLSSRRNLNKNYSGNVFARMVQYGYERQTKKVQLLKTRRKEEGDFSPVLCSKSIEIAQKLKTSISKSQRSMHHHSHCQIPKEKMISHPQARPKKSPLKVEKQTPLKEKTTNTKANAEKSIQKQTAKPIKSDKRKENIPTAAKTTKKKLI